MLRWRLCTKSGCLPRPKQPPKAKPPLASRADLEEQLQAALRRAEAAEIQVDALLAEVQQARAQSPGRPCVAREAEEVRSREEEVRNLATENRALRERLGALEALKAGERDEGASTAREDESAATAREECEALRCRLASAQRHAADLGEVAKLLELETQAKEKCVERSNALIATRRVRQLTAGLRRLEQQLGLNLQPGADDDEVWSERHEGDCACQQIQVCSSLQSTSPDGQSSDSRRREKPSHSGELERAGLGPVFFNMACGDSDEEDENDAAKDDLRTVFQEEPSDARGFEEQHLGESFGSIKSAKDEDIDWYLAIDDGQYSTQDDGADADNEASPQPRTVAHPGLHAESPLPSIGHNCAVEACLVDDEEDCVLSDVRNIEWFPAVEEFQAGVSESDFDGSMLPPHTSHKLSDVASIVNDLDDENWPSVVCSVDWEVEAAVSRVSIQVMLGH